jgi:hypothetical protein
MEGHPYYEVISADPDRLTMFNKGLVQMNETMPTLGMFPFKSLKEEVLAEPDRPFIVDIGGGHGGPLKTILQEAEGGWGAQCILQDRPDVLAQVNLPGVTNMEHDFFTTQPVKNAHIYLFRRIMHDFYEPVCVQILKQVVPAMGPKSRLLIGDFLVPEKANMGDDNLVYWMDFAMMMVTGKEKTKAQFESISKEAGLKLVKIWQSPATGQQAILELVKKDA